LPRHRARISAGGRNRAHAQGIGDFPLMHGPGHREREMEADRWAATAHGAHKVVSHTERERKRAGRVGS
jgi:hypothetical protein